MHVDIDPGPNGMLKFVYIDCFPIDYFGHGTTVHTCNQTLVISALLQKLFGQVFIMYSLKCCCDCLPCSVLEWTIS